MGSLPAFTNFFNTAPPPVPLGGGLSLALPPPDYGAKQLGAAIGANTGQSTRAAAAPAGRYGLVPTTGTQQGQPPGGSPGFKLLT
jgi:hypothetical protein